MHDKEDVVDARGAARDKERISIVAAAGMGPMMLNSDSWRPKIELATSS